MFEYLDNKMYTAWKVSKNGVFSGPPFPAIQSKYVTDQKKLRIEKLFTQWYKEVKETIKQYFLVRMEEACGMRYPWNSF